MDLGLYYLRARYYNPTTGRFMGRDPGEGVLYSPLSLHKYLYGNGDPVNGLDPTGFGDAVEVGDIDTYERLNARSVVGDGIEHHHALPKSIACLFMVSAGKMIAIALLPGPHQAFDNAWNNWFREIGAQGQRCNEQIVTIEKVLAAAAIIYKANPEIMDAINNWIQGLAQYGLP